MMSARTIDISSITISSISFRSFMNVRLYFMRSRMRRGVAKSGSSGSSGLNGSLKNECRVTPPAFTAAMPVGARMTCRFFVFPHIWRRNVDLPVPALPVRNTDCRVWLISCHADWNSGLSRSISWMVLSSIFSVGVCAVRLVFSGWSIPGCRGGKNMCGRQYLLRSNSVKCRLTP